MYVSTRLKDGLGNRFFQVAAMLGYAEKHGHTPLFLREAIEENNHKGPKTITDYFPAIRTEDASGTWLELKQPADLTFTYVNLPSRTDANILMNGHWQCESYFPKAGIPRPAILDSVGLPDFPFDQCIFLHVRRGDYMLPVCAHHFVDLRQYWRYALSFIIDDPTTRILVVSDDMEWCALNLPVLYADLVAEDKWYFFPSSASDYETLAAMTRCRRGGICANSSFSWWGGYWNVSRDAGVPFFMPGVWGYPPMPPAREIYPSWSIVTPTS